MSAEDESIKRFDFYYLNDLNYEYPAFCRESEDGEYVSFEDYTAIEREVAALRAEAAVGERWREDSSLEKWFPLTAQHIHDLTNQLFESRDALHRNGFVRCDIPACNCGSWHYQGGYKQRFSEIDEATRDEYQNGETLLARVQRIMKRIAALEAENAALMDAGEVLAKSWGVHDGAYDIDAAINASKVFGVDAP